MKKAGILLLLFGIVFSISRVVMRVSINFEYANKIGCNWDLSERASTIKQKSEYMDKFVKALEKCNLDGINDAIFYPTPESDFSENLKAVKSLQQRLLDISSMDENSLAYQTALQQITAQEQGEAHQMTSTLWECWEQKYYYTYWNGLVVTGFILLQFLLIVMGFTIAFDMWNI